VSEAHPRSSPDILHRYVGISTVSSSEVQRLITAARLSPYRGATQTLDDAVELYRWNSIISGELFVVLGHTEIVLRNALDRELRKSRLEHAGTTWLADRATLRRPEQTDIQMATDRRIKKGNATGHDDIISELPFGFWRYLLSSKYEATLWTPYLRHSFPHFSGSPNQIRRAMERLHTLRNRIAHHEPIFHRNLNRDRDDCLRILSWIDAKSKVWVKNSTASALKSLQSRP